MKDKFTVDFDHLTQTLLPKRAYRLADVENRIERVAYDLVRFRDNQDTDQLWKIQDGSDGPVIVALYGDDGGLAVESNQEAKNDWEAVPDKKAMHIYYKGEPLVSLSSDDMGGIPESEFSVARRWLPVKLASDENLQKAMFSKVASRSRQLICERFPELTKVAAPTGEVEEDDYLDREEDDEAFNMKETGIFGDSPDVPEVELGEWNPDDLTSEQIIDDDPPNWQRQDLPEPKDRFNFEDPDATEEVEPETTKADVKDMVTELLTLFEEGAVSKDKVQQALLKMVASDSIKKLVRKADVEPPDFGVPTPSVKEAVEDIVANFTEDQIVTIIQQLATEVGPSVFGGYEEAAE